MAELVDAVALKAAALYGRVGSNPTVTTIGNKMTKQERIELEIEKASYQEVIRQFIIHDCDSRMCTKLNAFLSSIENKIKEIENKLNVT